MWNTTSVRMNLEIWTKYIRDVYSNNISSATYDVSILAHVFRKSRKLFVSAQPILVNLHLKTEEFKCTKLFCRKRNSIHMKNTSKTQLCNIIKFEILLRLFIARKLFGTFEKIKGPWSGCLGTFLYKTVSK